MVKIQSLKFLYIYIYEYCNIFLYILKNFISQPYLRQNAVLSFKSRTEGNNEKQYISASS